MRILSLYVIERNINCMCEKLEKFWVVALHSPVHNEAINTYRINTNIYTYHVLVIIWAFLKQVILYLLIQWIYQLLPKNPGSLNLSVAYSIYYLMPIFHSKYINISSDGIKIMFDQSLCIIWASFEYHLQLDVTWN